MKQLMIFALVILGVATASAAESTNGWATCHLGAQGFRFDYPESWDRGLRTNSELGVAQIVCPTDSDPAQVLFGFCDLEECSKLASTDPALDTPSYHTLDLVVTSTVHASGTVCDEVLRTVAESGRTTTFDIVTLPWTPTNRLMIMGHYLTSSSSNFHSIIQRIQDSVRIEKSEPAH